MEHTRNETKAQDFESIAYRVSVISIVGNILLSLVKLLAGIFAHSNAMMSDALHSASDVFSTIVVMLGVRLASKASDKEHPYGHERMECIAAILLSAVLFLTGLLIGWHALQNMFQGNSKNLVIPNILALIAATISIVVKEGMYWYTRHYAKKIDSSALLADAWHHRSDALSSIGAFLGIAGARMGFPVLDSAASLIIFFFITKAAWDIFKDAMDKLVDHSCDDSTEAELYSCIMEEENITSVDMLHTRMFGNRIYADIEIGINRNYTLQESHGIAKNLHDKIEGEFPKVKHVMILVNPTE